MTWIFWLFVIGCFGYESVVGQGQRVAPGVPPQHYQQQQHVPQHQQQPPYQQPQHPPPPQQQQQQQYPPPPQQQQQQQFQQPHQVPVQPHQQNVPQGGPNVGHGHGHGHGHDGPPQILNAANIAAEKEHIGEHIGVPSMDTSKMTEQELQFHYFKMHDADNNNKLDGCELIKSLIHWHDQGNNAPQSGDHDTQGHPAPTVGDKVFTDEELVNLIDPILNMDDNNKDGFIDYSEFILAQQKAAAPTTP
ncbi:transcription factor mef2A-like isoform X2 [Aphidius gifuensis]|uniref:transcription factor mef2A-like isoform X2 n=1 Tax=Aphidius gifuensis TaxID=684658 RepID=UPI001CDD12FD|nr:transcription factor mef2A-like isoform X2 [Aphidius gifuensis]